jgi:HAD superfamily hydrolase (TIGR01450 family)
VQAGPALLAYRSAMNERSPLTDPADLRRAFAGVRALILDADGVLTMKGAALPGSVQAVRALAEAGIPFRVATNYSSVHHATLAERFAAGGFPVTPETIVTSGRATAAYIAEAHPGQPILVLNGPDGLREYEADDLLAPEDADAPGARAAAVVIGDGHDGFSFANLNRAFRLIRGGAELVAATSGTWWLTEAGPTLDGGSFAAALELATGRRARVCGKPSPVMYRTAFAALAAEIRGRGASRLRARDVLMVGDDPRQDLSGARRLGMRTVLVLSGRTTAPQAGELLAAGAASATAAAAGGRRRLPASLPDAVAATLADIVAALS